MAANKFATMLHKKTNKLTLILVYVILEWILILLLLLNSLYSYLIIKFVDYFGLKRPCIWCSRLDHIFEPQKYKNLHRDLVCENHATEISKLGYCSDHQKLAELHDMCGDCSRSTGQDASKIAFFRWVKDIGMVTSEAEKNCEVELNCSCCDASLDSTFYSPCVLIKPSWEVMDYAQEEKSIQEAAVGDSVNQKHDLNQTDMDRHIDDDDDNDKIEVTKHQIADEADEADESGEEHIHENESSEVIKDSCSDETLIQISEKGASLQILHQADRSLMGEIIDGDHSENSDIEAVNKVEGGLYLEKEVTEALSIYEASSERKFALIESMELEENEDYLIFHATREDIVMEVEKQAGNAQAVETVFEVYDAVQATMEDLAIDIHEQVAITQATQATSRVETVTMDLVMETPEQVAINQATQKEAEDEEDDDDDVQATMEDTVMDVHEQFVITQTTETLSEVDDEVPATMEDLVVEEREQVVIAQATETPFKVEDFVQATKEDLIAEVHDQVVTQTTHDACENGVQLMADQEHASTYPAKLIENEDIRECANQIEEEQVEQERISVKINERVMNMDLTLCFEHGEFEEDKFPSTPTSTDGLHNLYKKMDSLDGSVISEFESGEVVSTVEKLQSALKAERKVLNALYAELEEERSASAIAANQTMAMINRLQEEKSSMQMESIQYQRMMEEQSEYDQEALQLLNELMVKREKEKQELERELEVYRKKVIDYEMKEKFTMMKRIRDSNSSIASFGNAEDSDEQSVDTNHENGHENGLLGFNNNSNTSVDEILNLDESLAHFEEERLSILDQLKVLEAKLFTLDDEDQDKFTDVNPIENFYEEHDENALSFNETDHDHHQQQQEKNKIIPLKPKILLPLFDAVSGETEDYDLINGFEPVLSQQSLSTKSETESNKHVIEEEVDHVYERLRALEADREFLRHCIGSLKKGDRGIDLLQEILLHLRDLRNVDLRAKSIGDSGSPQ